MSSVAGTAVRGLELAVSRATLWVWSSPWRAAICAFGVYFVLGVLVEPSHRDQSGTPYFIYLAEAFLRGELGLVSQPPGGHDLVFYGGRTYLYWPPFPAVLFMPFVALLGAGISDQPVNLVVGSLNVALVSLVLREIVLLKIADVPDDKRAWLTAFFALGTVHVALAPYATVWATSQIVAFCLEAAATVVALRLPGWRGAMSAGVLAGCAFLTRTPTVLALAWVVWYCGRREWGRGRRDAITAAVAAAAPFGVAVALYAAYNFARFGNPIDIGYAYHNMAVQLRPDYEAYGPFSLHYLPRNLYYYLLAVPYISLVTTASWDEFLMGGSIFIMSPVLLLGLRGIARPRSPLGWMLAVSCLAGLAPALLLFGTGWRQFGSRYMLDVAMPMIVASAIGAQGVSTRTVAYLAIASMAIFLPGALLFGPLLFVPIEGG